MTAKYWVFEYMYRDAGNWKTFGTLLLSGKVEEAVKGVREWLDGGDLFVAEQVGIPSLCAEHFAACADGPSGLDHAYHEFIELRLANEHEIASLPICGVLGELLTRIQAAAGSWDVRLSPNCWL